MRFLTILLILSAILTFKVNGDESFTIQFDNWDLKKCPGRTSKTTNPEINIFNPPQETKILTFWVKDLDIQKNHGGGKIEFNGEKVIKAGSFKYYRPCPPSSEVHTYKWTVIAYDKDNKKLGKTSFKKKYPVK